MCDAVTKFSSKEPILGYVPKNNEKKNIHAFKG